MTLPRDLSGDIWPDYCDNITNTDMLVSVAAT